LNFVKAVSEGGCAPGVLESSKHLMHPA
jgi:hypothetical protein